MATLERKDIWAQGTRETQAFLEKHHDRAIQIGLVTGLDNDAGDTEDIIDTMYADIGDDHHNQTDLPLVAITARKISTTKGLAIARYARSRASTPTQSADALTSRSPGHWSWPWYRTYLDDGGNESLDSLQRPNGLINFAPHSQADANYPGILRPVPWTWRHGISVFRMPTVLPAIPGAFALYTTYVGRINSNNVAQFVVTGGFGAGTLRFEGTTLTPIEVRGGVRYVIEYIVSYNPYTWQRMLPPVFNTFSGEWTTSLVNAYPTVAFPTFAVHA